MARGRKQAKRTRIEPRFDDGPVASRGLTATRDAHQSKAKSKPKTKRTKRGIAFRIARFFTYWGVIFGLWGGIAAACVVAFYAAKLPSADTWAVPERPPNIAILANDGSLIGNRGATGGKALRLEEMSPHIAQAVIAIEDRRFHAHFGFDPIGFTRAMTRNIMQRRLREGGSTITQQLAKNLFLTPERSFGRKIQELILAFWLEAKYSKAELLELYLNRVYFGAGATGVDAAARRYFGKSARYVTIPEAALLAGLLKAPSYYSPARSEKRAYQRARVVMRAMQREGYIEPGTIDIATVKPGENAKHFRSGPEHFVTDMVAKRVRAVLGEVKRDVIVRTTIDPFAMLSAQSAVDAAFASKTAAKGKVSQAALVSMVPDGAVKALIGGRNYAASQFNRAADAKRQPGSAFKSFVWLAALENGRLPSDVISDAPVRYGKWAPKNYGNKHYGQLSLSRALAISSNTVAARLIHEVGPQRVATVAQRLGIESKLSSNYSLALGSSEVGLMELAAAHAPFANGGQRAMPHIITRITDTEGRVLHEHRRIGAQMVVWPANVGEMNRMLRGVVEQGTARKAQVPGHMIAGKTGTSQQFRDAVFVGWSAHAVTAVWFGNDNNSPTRKLTGGSLPASTFANYMGALHQGLSAKPLPGFNADEMLVPLALTKPTFRPGTVRTREELVAQVSEETPKRRSILDILLQR